MQDSEDETMRTKLIRIGNSQGVRLPRTVIEQAGLGRDLDLEVEEGTVVIRAAREKRRGWAEAAKACHAAGDDDLDSWDTTVGDFEGDWA
jgi:antitoxin MazE